MATGVKLDDHSDEPTWASGGDWRLGRREGNQLAFTALRWPTGHYIERIEEHRLRDRLLAGQVGIEVLRSHVQCNCQTLFNTSEDFESALQSALVWTSSHANMPLRMPLGTLRSRLKRAQATYAISSTFVFLSGFPGLTSTLPCNYDATVRSYDYRR